MAPIVKAVRGTQDVLPAGSYKWQYLEQTVLQTASLYGFSQMRTPVFESTALFHRSVGETTDVVQKEMYTFEDKGGRSITLRPEGTAGAARALLEHGLHNQALPVKVSYVTSCYRYEKPQAGRLREFHQFGVECFGTPAPQADAELIRLAGDIIDRLGLTGVSLQINSIGCPNCRPSYHEALRAYFSAHEEALCPTCRERLTRNPMRILDCKCPECAAVAKEAPRMAAYLCNDCASHFETVKAILSACGQPFEVNTSIVRGLDYYTKTVFEFVSDSLGAQAVVCGGGRYDGLIEELGGPSLPSLGFAMGLERLLLAMEAEDCPFPAPKTCSLFLASMGEEALLRCQKLVAQLRKNDIYAACDVVGRGLKAQLKYADKIGARFTAVIGDNELQTGQAMLKNMQTGETTLLSLDETLPRVVASCLAALPVDGQNGT